MYVCVYACKYYLERDVPSLRELIPGWEYVFCGSDSVEMGFFGWDGIVAGLFEIVKLLIFD